MRDGKHDQTDSEKTECAYLHREDTSIVRQDGKASEEDGENVSYASLEDVLVRLVKVVIGRNVVTHPIVRNLCGSLGSSILVSVVLLTQGV